MKIITFEEGQSGEEWLNWRKNGIGASDISIIMGSNPYKTPLQLWETKCGFREEEEMNEAIKHGIRHEEIARQWVNEHFNLHLTPYCIEEDENPYFRASLDGFDLESRTLCEIKCPVSEKVLDKARMQQVIPDYWYDQMQWQIMLSNPQRAFIALWDYRHKNCITLDMFGSTEKIENMRKKGKEFWEKVKKGIPPAAQGKDYPEIQDNDLQQYLLEYADLTKQEKVLSDRKKELKKKIEGFGRGGNFISFGFKVQRMTSSPSYNIDQMRMDGLPVDDYIKKSGNTYWYRIICPNSLK